MRRSPCQPGPPKEDKCLFMFSRSLSRNAAMQASVMSFLLRSSDVVANFYYFYFISYFIPALNHGQLFAVQYHKMSKMAFMKR